MAGQTHVPDIERAERQRSVSIHHDKQGSSANTEAEAPLQDIKRLEAQKVIVLSFRSLQLRRIAELQDELLSLTVKTADSLNLSDNHNSIVDKTLRNYGECFLVGPWCV